MSNLLKRFAPFLCFVFLFNCLPLAPLHAETTSGEVRTFASCVDEPEENCIESISAPTPDGKSIKGVLTNIRTDVDFNAGTFWHAKGTIPVYEFPGLKFGYGTSRLIVRSFYWPDNSEYCAYGTCTLHNESVMTWVNPYAPGISNPMFDTNVLFKLTIHVPFTFQIFTSYGRAKNVSFTDSTFRISNNFKEGVMTKSIWEISFSPIKLEQVDFGSSDPTAANRAISFEDSPTIWLYGLDNDVSSLLEPCIFNVKVLHILNFSPMSVYSNAVSMNMPKWNEKDKTIDIWTKSPHLTTTGELNTGYIEARIPLAMAKCMWGVNLEGNISGKISVTYEDGSAPSTVTMTGNVTKDDYLLIIAGFHFSAPTFHIKLDQSMGEKPISVVAKAKTTTIICVKGKLSKKVTGVSPTCPAGYKKK